MFGPKDEGPTMRHFLELPNKNWKKGKDCGPPQTVIIIVLNIIMPKANIYMS